MALEVPQEDAVCISEVHLRSRGPDVARSQERETKAKRMRPPGLNDQRTPLSRGPSGLPRSGKSGNEGEADATTGPQRPENSAEPGPERPATQWQERKEKWAPLLSRRPVTDRCALSGEYPARAET